MIKKLGLGCGALFLLLVVIGIASSASRPSGTSAPPTPGQTQSPLVTAPAAAATTPGTPVPPTPAPAPTPFNFGSGKKIVPTEIPPGTYRTRTGSAGCYWERLSGLGGTFGEIISNDNTDGPAVVTIADTDKGFNSARCAQWSADLSAITTSKIAPFGSGAFIVGVDIEPGTWRSSGGTSCYWERQSGFGGGFRELIANDNTGPSTVVTIAATDKGFKSTRCGTWTKVG